MSQQELLRRVVKELEELDVEYMLTGSLVSSLQGEPRATHDKEEGKRESVPAAGWCQMPIPSSVFRNGSRLSMASSG